MQMANQDNIFAKNNSQRDNIDNYTVSCKSVRRHTPNPRDQWAVEMQSFTKEMHMGNRHENMFIVTNDQQFK